MNVRKPNLTAGVRVLFGIVGLVMLAKFTQGVWAGELDMHGEAFRRTDHPLGFWIYAAFVGGLGMSFLYGATFGNRRKSDR